MIFATVLVNMLSLTFCHSLPAYVSSWLVAHAMLARAFFWDGDVALRPLLTRLLLPPAATSAEGALSPSAAASPKKVFIKSEVSVVGSILKNERLTNPPQLPSKGRGTTPEDVDTAAIK